MTSIQIESQAANSVRDVEHFQSQYAEIASLAGGLAHEIRNPLSTIRLNLDLMAEDLDPEENSRDGRLLRRLQVVQRECGHLEQILDAFLQFARIGNLITEPVDLNSVVNEFIAFYQPQAREGGIEISRHLQSGLPLVSLDSAKFRQVLMNLALNAQQAMPDGGQIELQTHLRDQRVLLDMIDTGTGMDEKTRLRIFQTFFSTKREGSGLGLPTVRKIVEAHGGTIECESEPRKGTRFTISLPIANTKSEPTSAKAEATLTKAD